MTAAALQPSCLRWASPERQQLWGKCGHVLFTPAAASWCGGCPMCKCLLSCPRGCACSGLLIRENVFPRQGVPLFPRLGARGARTPAVMAVCLIPNPPPPSEAMIIFVLPLLLYQELKADLPAVTSEYLSYPPVRSKSSVVLPCLPTRDFCGKPLWFSHPLLLPYQSRGG